jgi:hypothetical protein
MSLLFLTKYLKLNVRIYLPRTQGASTIVINSDNKN